MKLDIKVKIGIISAVAVLFGIIIYVIAVKSDKNSVYTEVTTYEDITKEVATEGTSEATTLTAETTTAITSTQTTTQITTLPPQVQGHIVEAVENLPTSPVDKDIVYNGKTIALNMTMDSVKAAIGNPIVLLEETTQAVTEIAYAENSTEITTEVIEDLTDEGTITVSKANNIHRYRELIIITDNLNGNEVVKDIEVISDDIKNAAGISPINKEIFEITLSYGAPSYEDWSICKYSIDDNSSLYFKLSEGKVSSWGIALNE